MSPRRKPAFQDFQEFSEPVPCAGGRACPLSLYHLSEPVPCIGGLSLIGVVGVIFRACPLSERALGLKACPLSLYHLSEPVPDRSCWGQGAGGSLSLVLGTILVLVRNTRQSEDQIWHK